MVPPGGDRVRSRAAGTQCVGVVDGVAAGEDRGNQRHRLLAGVRSACNSAQLEAIEGRAQSESLREGGGQQESSVGHQAEIVEGYAEAVEVVRRFHLTGAPC